MKTLRLGLIGVGGRGGLAYFAHQPENGAQLVAGADIDEAALSLFKDTYGPEVFVCEDYRDLLSQDLDAVFITSPDYCHEEHAVAALEAGLGVYLEKPMAISIEGCDRILETARRRQAKLFLGHNMRHMAFIRKMKELIDGGVIGEVKTAWCRHFIAYGGDAYFKDWHAEQSKTNSLLVHKGTHDIDILHWLCGGYSTRVCAMGALSLYNQISSRHDPALRGDASWHEDHWPPLSQTGLNPVIDVEDLSMMLMQLDNGVLCSYQQCHYTPDAWRNYTVIGTEGRLENSGDLPGHCVIRVWNKRGGYLPEGRMEFPIPLVEGSHGGADPSIVNEFLAYLRGQAQPATSPVAARYSVAAGCMASVSLRNGGNPQQVPPLPPTLTGHFPES